MPQKLFAKEKISSAAKIIMPITKMAKARTTKPLLLALFISISPFLKI
jgi:hypothetical protein